MKRVTVVFHALILFASVPGSLYAMIPIYLGKPTLTEFLSAVVFVYGAMSAGRRVWVGTLGKSTE